MLIECNANWSNSSSITSGINRSMTSINDTNSGNGSIILVRIATVNTTSTENLTARAAVIATANSNLNSKQQNWLLSFTVASFRNNRSKSRSKWWQNNNNSSCSISSNRSTAKYVCEKICFSQNLFIFTYTFIIISEWCM